MSNNEKILSDEELNEVSGGSQLYVDDELMTTQNTLYSGKTKKKVSNLLMSGDKKVTADKLGSPTRVNSTTISNVSVNPDGQWV